jgi:hypothetical protein
MPTSQAAAATTGSAFAGTLGGVCSFFDVFGLIFLIVDDQQAAKWSETMNTPTKRSAGLT